MVVNAPADARASFYRLASAVCRTSTPATVTPHPSPTQPHHAGSRPMVDKIIRFIEALIDAFNFGSSISK
jgi:hypothetical protein